MADRVQMPSSGGGLVSYHEDTNAKLQIPPLAVLVAIVVVILVEIYVYKFI